MPGQSYNDYLLNSLCKDDSAAPVSELPKISVTAVGAGSTISFRIRPTVRWSKLVERFRGLTGSESVPWPLTVTSAGGFRVTSLQESVCDSFSSAGVLLPDELTVQIGPVEVCIVPEVVDDVPPPSPPPPSAPSAPEPVERGVSWEGVVRVKIEKLKLNVKLGCTVNRLIRKWTQAAGKAVDGGLVHDRSGVVDGEKKLGEIFTPKEIMNSVSEPIILEIGGKAPQKSRTSLCEEKPVVPTPSRAASSRSDARVDPEIVGEILREEPPKDRKRRKVKSHDSDFDVTKIDKRDQEIEFMILEQKSKVGQSDQEEIDEELAMAIALSLSENVK
jgi:hypothetical protein